MYLVDTNVLSEARRKSPEATAWFETVDPASIYLSVLTLGEIMRGIARKQRTDPLAAGRLSEWLRHLRRAHADRILPVTDRVATEWGRIVAIRPRGDVDALIAATAIAHDFMLVTRNVTDFADVGVPVIDPWAVER
jgi:toxin FitB